MLRERGTNGEFSGEAMMPGLCEISGLLAQPHVWLIDTLGLRGALGSSLVGMQPPVNAASLMWSRGKVMAQGDFPRASWRRPSKSQGLPVIRPAPTQQQSRNLLVKLGLLGPPSTVPRHYPNSQCLSVKLVFFWPGKQDTGRADVTAAAKSAGEAWPCGIAKHSISTESKLAEVFGEGGTGRSLSKIDLLIRHCVVPRQPAQQSQSLLMFLLRSQSTGQRQNPNSQRSLVSFMTKLGVLGPEHMARPAPQSHQTKSVDEARPPGFVIHCATSESESEVESSGEKFFGEAEVHLRTALLMSDTRAVWDSISQMKDLAEKDASDGWQQ